MIENLSSKVLIILALLYVHPSWAFGEFNMDGMPDLSASRFNMVCSEIADGNAREENFNQGLCVGIILGVEDNAHYDKKICVPKNIGIKERVIVIRGYIATQPKRTNETFASLVFDALIEKWPCKN